MTNDNRWFAINAAFAALAIGCILVALGAVVGGWLLCTLALGALLVGWLWPR
jgi:hypothetical protein